MSYWYEPVILTVNSRRRTTMFTRDEYAQGLCTSQEYYVQFITHDVFIAVREWLSRPPVDPAVDAVMMKKPMGPWLPVAKAINTERLRLALETRGDSPSAVALVCVAKAAAKILSQTRVDNNELNASSFIADREWGW